MAHYYEKISTAIGYPAIGCHNPSSWRQQTRRPGDKSIVMLRPGTFCLIPKRLVQRKCGYNSWSHLKSPAKRFLGNNPWNVKFVNKLIDWSCIKKDSQNPRKILKANEILVEVTFGQLSLCSRLVIMKGICNYDDYLILSLFGFQWPQRSMAERKRLSIS